MLTMSPVIRRRILLLMGKVGIGYFTDCYPRGIRIKGSCSIRLSVILTSSGLVIITRGHTSEFIRVVNNNFPYFLCNCLSKDIFQSFISFVNRRVRCSCPRFGRRFMGVEISEVGICF